MKSNGLTIFSKPTIINGNESWYSVTKPSYEKNKQVHSSLQNDYKGSSLVIDSHCCGVTIVINCTFTAGGLSSPFFVVVYGLTPEEMPADEIVTTEVPQHTFGSDQDVYSYGIGYLTFVWVMYSKDDADS